eukprot:7386795-Prymnesium_polylepis.1
MARGRDGAAAACWRGATVLLPPAAVAPPGDRQSPTPTVILGRQPAEAPSPPGGAPPHHSPSTRAP